MEGPFQTRSLPCSPRLRVPPLSHVRQAEGDTEKSARRIAGYVTAYSPRATLRPQTSRDWLVPSRGLLHTERTQQRRTVENSPETLSKDRDSQRKTTAREYSVSSGKSDILELQRDLSTYDFRLSRALRLTDTLQQLSRVADGLPDAIDISAETTGNAKDLFTVVRDRLVSLSTDREQSSPPRCIRLLRIPLRATSTTHRLLLCFRGVRTISCVPCFLTVLSNQALSDLRVHVLTLHGLHFSLCVSQKPVSECNARKYVTSVLLPQLFLKEDELCCDSGCGKTFLSLNVRLHGQKRAAFVMIREHHEGLMLSCTQAETPLLLSPGTISSESVFRLPLKQLQRVLEDRVLVQSGRLSWCAEGVRGAGFRAKERNSRLLDPAYLSYMIREFEHGAVCREEVEVEGASYLVELFARNRTEKLRISRRDHSEELNPDSPLLFLLRGLQFSLLQRSTTTFLRCLELELVIKRLFGRAH